MPYTPEKIKALANLDSAIEQCLEAFGSFDEGEIPLGWAVVVCGTRAASEQYDENWDIEDDTQEMVSRYTSFTRRGQIPVLTRGMLESYMDRYRM